MLSRRQTEMLLDFYANAENIIQIKHFSKKYNVSTRTIQNDITILKESICQNGMSLETIKSKGLLLTITDKTISQNYINSLAKEYNRNQYFEEQSSRVLYLLTELLNADTYIKSSDLADQMFISRSQISNDLKQVKKIIENYNLTFQSKPYFGLQVLGTEINKRNCIIQEKLKTNYLFYPLQDSQQNDKYINQINDIISNILIDAHYLISDIALQNLILHIATSVERLKMGEMIELETKNIDPTFYHVHEIAKKIISTCADIFHFQYNEDEILFLALNLHGKREYDKQEFISDEISTLVFSGLLKIKENYGIDFTSNLNLRISLGLHVLPLVTRVKTGMLLKNIMTFDIKQRFPLAFDLASLFARTILPDSAANLSDDELTYIALHFCNYIEESKSKKQMRMLLITARKRSESILLQQKILRNFSDISEVVIISIHQIRSVNFEEFNAIITTEMYIHEKYSNIAFINYFLDEQGIKKIELLLEGFNYTKDILDSFDEDLFYHGNVKDKQNAIDILYQKAATKGYADQALYDSIMQHEKVSSTYFGNNLAIPHPETLYSEKSFISVAVLKNTIDWNHNDVDIVFLVSIEKDNPKAYRLWFYLSFLISDSIALQQIKEIPTFENLKTVIAKIYNNLF